MRRRRALLLATSLAFAVPPAATAAPATLVVHLPSEPIESAVKLGEAVTALGSHLSASIPGLDLDVQVFRRRADALARVEAAPAEVAMILADAAFLLDLAPSLGFAPSHAFVRNGQDTYRRLLVVAAARSELKGLPDLRGRSLTVVEAAGASEASYLERAVFEGALSPERWFASLDHAVDDFTATANVLYGQTDSALVAEHNPLLASKLGGELRAVFTSPPLSLPVLALRAGALDSSQRDALTRALADLAGAPAAERALADLQIDGLRPLGDATRVASLPAAERKPMELAGAAGATLPPALPPLPKPADLPFAVGVELPDIPISAPPSGGGGRD